MGGSHLATIIVPDSFTELGDRRSLDPVMCLHEILELEDLFKKSALFWFLAFSASVSSEIAINSSAIESREVGLFKTSKIIQKVHRSSENDRF